MKQFSVTAMPGFATMAIGAFVLLYVPILTLVAFSFNGADDMTHWGGFSVRWYAEAFENDEVQAATLRSLVIASWATLISVVLATPVALATTRTRPYRGRSFIYLFINQTLVVPEIVPAVALLIFFASVKIATGYTGLGYLIVAHVMWCVPLAYLPIRARLEGMDLSLETAAADLYASRWQTLRHVTLPLLLPGILAGGMLCFITSLDTVVITEFVKSGGQDTLATYMLGQFRRGITPEINAISAVLLALTILLLTAFFLLTRKRD
jgi:spermidine/putrescine transport system permease protein